MMIYVIKLSEEWQFLLYCKQLGNQKLDLIRADMAKDYKMLAGQKAELILKSLESIITEEGDMAPLHMKNHLATTFFRMIMNEEDVDDRLRNTARSYLQLFEFLSTFDEQVVEKK